MSETIASGAQPETVAAGTEPGVDPDGSVRPTLWAAAAADFTDYRNGDRDALDRLVRRLTPLLWHVVRGYRLDRATAEDVVQSTWLALFRHADSIEEPQAVVRWLTVTARREAWRCSRVGQRSDPMPDDLLERPDAGSDGPESHTVRNARDQALWTALGALPERCQRLLRVIAFAPRPNYADVSRRLGIPVGSIGPTRARCLDKIREQLAAVDWAPR